MKQHRQTLATHGQQVERVALLLSHLKAEEIAATDIVDIVEAALATFLSREGFTVENGVTALLDGEIATDAMAVAQ